MVRRPVRLQKFFSFAFKRFLAKTRIKKRLADQRDRECVEIRRLLIEIDDFLKDDLLQYMKPDSYIQIGVVTDAKHVQ